MSSAIPKTVYSKGFCKTIAPCLGPDVLGLAPYPHTAEAQQLIGRQAPSTAVFLRPSVGPLSCSPILTFDFPIHLLLCLGSYELWLPVTTAGLPGLRDPFGYASGTH